MTLINKITSSWYDTAFTVSDDANIFENYNYASANPDGVLQSIYRYLQDHERRRNLNCIYGGFQTSLADSDTDLVIGISGTEDAEAIIAGRIVTMASAETMLVENGSLFPSDDTYYICLQLSTITETNIRDGSSGETFSWVALTSLSAIDDTYLVVCSVDVSGTQTLFSNLVQLAYPYEIEANKFRPKYDHSMSFYVGDGDAQARNLSVVMDWNYTTFYLPIKIDTIDEESTGVGVTIEGMLIRDITKIKADAEIFYVNTIDDFDAGTLTITPPTTITGAVTASSTINSVGDFSVNTDKMNVNATSGNSTIAGTLDVTGLITGTSGFSGALTGNVTGALTGNADTATQWETTRTITMTGDVTADNVNIDGTANVTITNTVVANDSHTHITSNITDLVTASTGITKVGTIIAGVWNGTAITSANINSITTSQISDLASASTGITDVGTIDTGVWQGTPLADAYVDDNISLINLTQITTRNHINLQNIGVDDHHNQRTQSFTLINELQTSHTKSGAGNQTWDDYSLRMSFTNADIDYARIKGAWLASADGTTGNATIQIRFEFPDTTNLVVDSKIYTSAGNGYEYFDYDLTSNISKFIDGQYKVQVYIINADSNLDGTGQINTISLDIG